MTDFSPYYLYLDSEFNADTVLCFCVADDQGNRWEFDTRDSAGDGVAQLATFVADNLDSTFVAFSVHAEMESMMRLGIKVPPHWIDLMPEAYQITMTHPLFRINERKNLRGQTEHYNNRAIGLIDVYQLFTLKALSKDYKNEMRDLILSRDEWSDADFSKIVDYCWSDVDALIPVWLRIRKFHASVNSPWKESHARYRGDVQRCMAEMMFRSSGFPVDIEWLSAIYANKLLIIHAQVDELSKLYKGYHLYEKTPTGAKVNQSECRRYARDMGIKWEQTESNQIRQSQDYLDDFVKSNPSLRPFKETRDLIIQLAKNRWLKGNPKDYQPPLIQNGAVKAVSLPFYAKTGRSQPMVNRGHILNARPFIRTIIKPPAGKVIIAADWSQQEIAIALAFFPDAALRKAYDSGDLYLAMAIMAGAVPEGATKKSHPLQRQSFKAVQLGLSYGMKEASLGRKLYTDLNAGQDHHVITLEEAMDRAAWIVQWHRNTFTGYWQGVKDFVRQVRLDGSTLSEDGWLYFADRDTPETQLQNLKAQSNGAAMLHFAALKLHSLGVDFLAEHHDALYVMADAKDEDETRALVVQAMNEAAELVVGTDIRIKVDTKVTRSPDRYADERADRMVEILNQRLAEIAASEQLVDFRGVA